MTTSELREVRVRSRSPHVTALIAAGSLACSGAESHPSPVAEAESPALAATEAIRVGAADEPARVVITLVATSDLHGHIERLPLLGGYVEALRSMRREDGGAVLLLDAGDMFQGTIESNSAEGAPVVLAYEALGYDAVTIGNHEFDFGPVGARSVPGSPDDDARGALRARILEADFPVLGANTLIAATGAPLGIGEARSVAIERAGVRIGLIGVTTESTLRTTMSGNVSDLRIAPLAATITTEAVALRSAGAAIVIVLAHAGGRCTRFDAPDDLESCDATEEVFEVAGALAPGTVDVIVAGHTHQAVAHRVHGTAIVQAYSYGRAFGRVDISVDRGTGRVVETRIHPPRDLCAERIDDDDDPSGCRRALYEGRVVAADARVASVIAPAMASARERRGERLGPVLSARLTHDRDEECPIGNLFTDLMRASRPEADVAVINGGGLRADLPEGGLTYGALFTAFPFDNRFALIRLTGAELALMLEHNATHDGSFLSVSGIRVSVRCVAGRAEASVVRADGRAVAPSESLTVLASDFMATGGDGFFAELLEREPSRVRIDETDTIRDAMAAVLRRRAGRLSPDELFDRDDRRVDIEGGRPLACR